MTDSREHLVAALFELEKSRDKGAILSVLERLLEWLSEPGQVELKRAFTAWMNHVMAPRGEPWDLDLEDPKEARDMLSKRMEEWREEARKQGLEQGLEQGRREGSEEGRREASFEILFSLMTAEFGDLPDHARERILQASETEIHEMARSVLVADRLEDVLGD